MEVINVKIDVTKISKTKLFKGEKGTYLNCTLVPTPDSQYGDFMVVEDTTKEERETGTKGVILGNGKKYQRADKVTETKKEETKTPLPEDDGEPLPF